MSQAITKGEVALQMGRGRRGIVSRRRGSLSVFAGTKPDLRQRRRVAPTDEEGGFHEGIGRYRR